MKQELLSKTMDLVGAGGVGNVIGRAFALMEIAEEELARAFPARVGEPIGIFRLLVSIGEMRNLGDDVYRAHARELIDRARGGTPLKDLLPLTKAEMLVGLYLASLAAPPNAVGFGLYVQLFGALFPEKAAKLPDVESSTGWLADEVATEFSQLSKKLSPERVTALADLNGASAKGRKVAKANQPDPPRVGPRARRRRS